MNMHGLDCCVLCELELLMTGLHEGLMLPKFHIAVQIPQSINATFNNIY